MAHPKKIAVVGAGLVGLASALWVKQYFPDAIVSVFEKENAIATHQSGHNSGVLHSGVYYRHDSLKAKFCVEGYRQMVEFCQKQEVSFNQIGKWIVATSPLERKALEMIYQRGIRNGVSGLRWLEAGEMKAIQPEIQGLAAVFSEQTGIVDFAQVAQKMQMLLAEKQVNIHLSEPVLSVKHQGGQARLVTATSHELFDFVIGCAGLWADDLAKQMGVQLDVRVIPFMGQYFMLDPSKATPLKHLIYPVPNPVFPFLGVHLTKMLSGAVKVGPNAFVALSRSQYRLDAREWKEFLKVATWPGTWRMGARYMRTGLAQLLKAQNRSVFLCEAQKFMPSLKLEDLKDMKLGIRAQCVDRKGYLLDDFYLAWGKRSLHVLNAPSPAATSCLAIGQHIAERLVHNRCLA